MLLLVEGRLDPWLAGRPSPRSSLLLPTPTSGTALARARRTSDAGVSKQKINVSNAVLQDSGTTH